jgi:hypothetical protein
MPGFRPVSNTVEVVLKGMRLGHEEINTFYFGKGISGLPISAADIADLLDAFITTVLPKYLATKTSLYTATELHGSDLTTATGAQAHRYLAGTNVGTRTSPSTPGNCSVGLRRSTSTRGRKWHGRIEMGSIAKDDVTNDTISNSLRDAFLNLIIQLLIDIVIPAGITWFNAHASRAAGSSLPIQAWTFDTVTDSQSTRLTGHGD